MKTIYKKQIADIFSSGKRKSKNKTPKEATKEKVIIDHRERNSLVESELRKLGLETELKELKVGDYIVKNVVIERKTISDFRGSMVNQRLLNQIEELKQYENKLILVEGFEHEELYPEKNFSINPNAIRGFLLSITLKHKVPVIFTKNPEDTAKFISVISKKQEREIRLNAKKKTLDKKEQLQFVIESFPGVGPKKSKLLLEKFGSIQNIILAPTEELEKILGKPAEKIREIIERKY